MEVIAGLVCTQGWLVVAGQSFVAATYNGLSGLEIQKDGFLENSTAAVEQAESETVRHARFRLALFHETTTYHQNGQTTTIEFRLWCWIIDGNDNPRFWFSKYRWGSVRIIVGR